MDKTRRERQRFDAMGLFDGILLASFVDSILHRRRMAGRRLRAMQRLLAECGPVQRFPEPPSPHRLLGEIARPLAASSLIAPR